MPLSKTLQRLFVDGYQVVRSGFLRLHDDLEVRFGTGDDVTQKYDSTNDRYVQDDRSGTTQLQIDVGNDLTDELEQGGLMELVIGNLLNFDPTEVIVDTRANQPAAGTADRVMFVTDDQVLEYDDGAAWNELGASAAAITQGGASAINVENFVTASTVSGQVPVSQGDGTLKMEGVAGPVISDTDQYIASVGG